MKSNLRFTRVWRCCLAILGTTVAAALAQNVGETGRNDSFQAVAAEDKQFLKQLDGTATQQPSPSAAAKPQPTVKASSSGKPRAIRVAAKRTVNDNRATSRQTGSVRRQPQQSASRPVAVRVSDDRPATREVVVIKETRTGPPLVTESQAEDFVEDFLYALEDRSPEEQLGFFADRVQYRQHGRVSKEFILQDEARFFQQWPDRRFDLRSEPEVTALGPDEALIRFRKRFKLENDNQESRGETETELRLRRFPEGPKIVAIQERQL